MRNKITIDELEKYLWGSAVLLRTHVDAGAYKQYIFPLLFFKRLSDVYDEECEKVIDPFYDNYDSYLEEYVIPEVIAFYIASSFYRNAMWEATFKQHFNSAFDTFNLTCKNYKKVKTEVIKLLRLKYSLEIINENSLDFKIIEY